MRIAEPSRVTEPYYSFYVEDCDPSQSCTIAPIQAPKLPFGTEVILMLARANRRSISLLIAATAVCASVAATLLAGICTAAGRGESMNRSHAPHRAARHRVRSCRAIAYGKGLPHGLRRAGSAASPQTTWAAPRTRPLSDAQAAALVRREPETRPANALANDYVPSASELAAFYCAVNQQGQTTLRANPLNRYVDGRDGLRAPSTDELIQWVAHKWTIPEDWIRADMAEESWWRMSTLSDRATVSSSWYGLYPATARISASSDVYESMGIAQIKWRPDGSDGAGTEPLRWKSTAFNLDYYAASVRYFYDGDCSWCGAGYGRGQQWNSIGAWYSPYPWANSGALSYIQSVQSTLSQRPWERPGF